MRNGAVCFAVTCLGRAGGTAEPECFEVLRIADRPAAHAGAQLVKPDRNRRGEGHETIATRPINSEVPCSVQPAAELALGSLRLGDFGHFSSAQDFYQPSHLSIDTARKLNPIKLILTTEKYIHEIKRARQPLPVPYLETLGPNSRMNR